LGTIAGKTLNLVNPIQFENGKIYYYLDANGDGKNSYVSGNISTYYLDAISHDYLDTLLNTGADTVDTQANGAKWGIDDERTLKLGSIYIVLPTSSEVKVDFSQGSYFWSGGTRYSTSDSVPVLNGTQQIWPTVGWDFANPFEDTAQSHRTSASQRGAQQRHSGLRVHAAQHDNPLTRAPVRWPNQYRHSNP
jgi:hypothetical protein